MWGELRVGSYHTEKEKFKRTIPAYNAGGLGVYLKPKVRVSFPRITLGGKPSIVSPLKSSMEPRAFFRTGLVKSAR